MYHSNTASRRRAAVREASIASCMRTIREDIAIMPLSRSEEHAVKAKRLAPHQNSRRRAFIKGA